MMDFLSEPKTIDFYASHEMQRQCGQSVFEALAGRHRCAWRGERDNPSPGAETAIVLGHISDFPQARKSRGGYSYAFFLSHDLGEMDAVYADLYMRQFDIVFTPGERHAANARRHLGEGQRVEIVGWPKYDVTVLGAGQSELAIRLAGLDPAKTIIYGPSYAQSGDWKKAFEVFRQLDATVIVKNHVYYSAAELERHRQRHGQDPAEIVACGEMEAAAREAGEGRFIVAPRELNICSLFPHARWLVSDSSSCLVEFGPFGTAVETLAPGEMHGAFPEVAYAPIEDFAGLYGAGWREGPRPRPSVYRHPGLGAGLLAARAIDAYFLSVPAELAREASRRRMGRVFRLELNIGEKARFALFLAGRAIRNPGLVGRVISRRRAGGSKGPAAAAPGTSKGAQP